MRKLNLKKVRWIVREMKRGEFSVYRIAKQQEVTPQWCRELYRRFRDSTTKDIRLKKPGRKTAVSPEGNMIMSILHDYPEIGAGMLEKLLQERGIKISHNKAHQVLLAFGIAKKRTQKEQKKEMGKI